MFDIFSSDPKPIDEPIYSSGMASLVFRGGSENAWKRKYRIKTTFTTTLVDDHGFVVPPEHRDSDDIIRPIEEGRTYKIGVRCYEHDDYPFSLLWDKAFIMYGTVGDHHYIPIPQLARQAYDLDEGSPIEVAISSEGDGDDEATLIRKRAVDNIHEQAPFDADENASRTAPPRPIHAQPAATMTATKTTDAAEKTETDALPDHEDLHVIIAAWLSDTDPDLHEYAQIVQGYPDVEDALLAISSVDDIEGVTVGGRTLTQADADAVEGLLDGDQTRATIVATLRDSIDD